MWYNNLILFIYISHISYISYLIHACVGEEEGGVIEGNDGGRVDVSVLLLSEEINERLPHSISIHARIHGNDSANPPRGYSTLNQ